MAEQETARPADHRAGPELAADQGSSSKPDYDGTPAELVSFVSFVSARDITDRIKQTVGSIAGQIEELMSLLTEARNADVHTTLGYRSWPAYVSAEFGGLLPNLDREQRRVLVGMLTQMGMSTRAIAPVVGTSHMTVERDAHAAVTDVPPDDEPPPFITGLDGKAYAATAARKVRRNPLPDQWRANQWQLTKVVERYERHVADDRFKANHQTLAGYAGELGRLIERLSVVRQQINEAGGPA